MGWLYQNDPVADVKNHFRTDVLRTSSPGYNYEVVDDAIAPGHDGERVYYAAVRYHKPDAAPEMFLLVCLFRNNKKDGFGYKDMTENMGPCEINCPLRLFKLVPEPVEGDAVEWRQRVRAYWAGKTAAPKIKAGDRIRLPKPIKFRGGLEADTFIVTVIDGRSKLKRTETGYTVLRTTRTVFRTESGALVAFPRKLLAGAEVNPA